jgi:hypothetical protein
MSFIVKRVGSMTILVIFGFVIHVYNSGKIRLSYLEADSYGSFHSIALQIKPPSLQTHNPIQKTHNSPLPKPNLQDFRDWDNRLHMNRYEYVTGNNSNKRGAGFSCWGLGGVPHYTISPPGLGD